MAWRRRSDPGPDPGSLGRYAGLALHLRGGTGWRPGERRVPGRSDASGIEIESYDPYAAGDDLRHLDWNALARLDALLVRRFTAARQVLFHLLVDASASMAVPEGEGKRDRAHELAVTLAFIALASGDAVRLTLLGTAAGRGPVLRQRAHLARVIDTLAESAPGGGLDLGRALEAYARSRPGEGAAIVISDLMTDPTELEAGVAALRARHHPVLLLHVLAASEMDPAGAFNRAVLRDVETGETRAVALTAAVQTRYREVLAEHLAAIGALAERTGSAYARLSTDGTVATFVLETLARLGVVRRR